MLRDELRKPLRRRGLFERLWSKRPSGLTICSLATFGLVAGFVAWLIQTPNPYGGEPVVIASIPPPETMQTASIDKPDEAAEEPLSEPDPAPPEETVIVRPGSQQVVQTDAAIIVAPRRPLAAAPIKAVSEEGPYGPLPVIGGGGKKPSAVYARQTPMGVLKSDAPKIAIVLGGMGLNAELTNRAIKDLPGEITFAFAPYGEKLQPIVNKARADGHEIMLQVPMEPMGYPASNPGPKTLLTSLDANGNLDALTWHMSRFAGYTGIMNYMGSQFLGNADAVKPVLSELRKRGLIYLGDGSVSQDTAATVAGQLGMPIGTARVMIDANPEPAAIAKALADLEEMARRNGLVIASGAGLPATIEAVGDWAKELGDKGIMLVPVSAAYHGVRG
jgi:polysaccharide deacetylase 2 family uncharacterized protein YibQ